MHNESKVFVGIGIGLLINLSLIVATLWLLISLGTSVAKVSSGQCGKTYKIESVVSGSWFCDA